MRRRLLFLSVLLGAASLGNTPAPAAAAEQYPTTDTIAVAAENGLDAWELQGALNSTGERSAAVYVQAEQAAAPVLDVAPWGLSPYLQRVARCESFNYRPDVVYGPTRGLAGEIGLFQLHPRGLLPLFFARGFSDPWNPVQQAIFATWAFANGLARNWSCAS